jgi:hypothetical protein
MSDTKEDRAVKLPEARDLEPMTGLLAISAEVANAGVWKDLAVKARALEESLREQIRRRDRLIETADIRADERIRDIRYKCEQRVHAAERERDEACAGEKRAVEELEALKKHTSNVWEALEAAKGKAGVTKKASKRGGE